MRLKGVDLHGLSTRDAAIVLIGWMEQVYPDESKRLGEWKKIARKAGVEIVEDPRLKAQRHARAMAIVESEMGDDL